MIANNHNSLVKNIEIIKNDKTIQTEGLRQEKISLEEKKMYNKFPFIYGRTNTFMVSTFLSIVSLIISILFFVLMYGSKQKQVNNITNQINDLNNQVKAKNNEIDNLLTKEAIKALGPLPKDAGMKSAADYEDKVRNFKNKFGSPELAKLTNEKTELQNKIKNLENSKPTGGRTIGMIFGIIFLVITLVMGYNSYVEYNFISNFQ
jgi:cell division protein FtsL